MALKILHTINRLNHNDGGPARSVPSLAHAVGNAGADVRIWTREPATIVRSDYPSVRFLDGEFHAAIADWQPDVIHDHGIWLGANHQIARDAARLNVPRVVSPRGMLEPWCMKHHWLRKKIAWLAYQGRDLRTAAALHATSPQEAEQFRNLGLHNRVIELPNGVPLPNLPQTSSRKSDDIREMLFLSRIHPKKGLLNLVEAWKQSVQPGWRLRIVGSDEGGHRGEVEAAAQAAGLQDSVIIQDPAHGDAKWELMQTADVFVLPSFSENFGIVIAEALAAGTPVITTTATPWNQLSDKRCGWCVKPEVGELSAAIQSAIETSDGELSTMGSRGQQWVRSEFDWNRIGAAMLDAYEELVAQAGWSSGSRQRAA